MRKRTGKKWLLCFASLLMLPLSCDLDKTEEALEETKPKKVGIVLPSDQYRWGEQDGPGLRSLLTDAGIPNVLYYGDGSTVTEAAQVQSVISGDCGVLLIAAVHLEDSSAAIAAAKSAGLTVVLYDRSVLGATDADFYVAMDNHEIGRLQGQALVDAASAGSGQPLYIYTGADWDHNSWAFLAGAWEALQPKIADGTFSVMNSQKAVDHKAKPTLTYAELEEIIAETTTGWIEATTTALVQSDLDDPSFSDEDPIFILGPNDYTARIIGDAFRTAGAEVTITGQDGEVASLQYIMDGKQAMSVIKRIPALISTAAALARSVAEGKSPSLSGTFDNGTVDIPYKKAPIYPVYTEEDIREAVEEGWYEESEFDWPED